MVPFVAFAALSQPLRMRGSDEHGAGPKGECEHVRGGVWGDRASVERRGWQASMISAAYQVSLRTGDGPTTWFRVISVMIYRSVEGVRSVKPWGDGAYESHQSRLIRLCTIPEG